jgi:hypothetical protein
MGLLGFLRFLCHVNLGGFQEMGHRSPSFFSFQVSAGFSSRETSGNNTRLMSLVRVFSVSFLLVFDRVKFDLDTARPLSARSLSCSTLSLRHPCRHQLRLSLLVPHSNFIFRSRLPLGRRLSHNAAYLYTAIVQFSLLVKVSCT